MKSSFALLALALGSMSACDPAKTGSYHGSFPDPPVLTMTSGAPDATIELAIVHQHDYRRWVKDGAVALGSATTPGSRSLDALWPSLVDALGNTSTDEALVGVSFTSVVAGTILGVPDRVFVVSNTGNPTFPAVRLFGVGGPVIDRLDPGFHVFRRSCDSATGQQLIEERQELSLTYDPAAAASMVAGIDPFLDACGLGVRPSFDLGVKVASAPMSDDGFARSLVTDMAWSPASDAVYLLAGDLARQGTKLLQYRPATQMLVQVGQGDYYFPLEVATGGTGLLVTRVGIGESSHGPYLLWADRVYVPVRDGQQANPVGLSPFTSVLLGQSTVGALSPDGSTLAVPTIDARGVAVVALVDVARGGITDPSVTEGRPVAWDPSGTKLFAQADDYPYRFHIASLVDGSTSELPVDPAAPSVWPYFTPWLVSRELVFWSVSGPKVLIQNDEGTRVYDFQTLRSTPIVEPGLVAPPSAPVAVVAATEQVFAWSSLCRGLAETSCASELRRLSLATGAIDVVARADEPLRFAVSADGRTLAIAYQDGLYLKGL